MAMRVLYPIAIAASVVACNQVRTSAVPTSGGLAPYRGHVAIRTTRIPGGARQLGFVEAHADNRPIEEILPHFVERVANMGGNFAKVDRIKTRYQMQTHSETYTYSCGTPKAPSTCTGVRTVTSEVGTTSVMGRAFLAQEKQR